MERVVTVAEWILAGLGASAAVALVAGRVLRDHTPPAPTAPAAPGSCTPRCSDDWRQA